MKYRLGEVCTITKGKIGISKAIEGNFPLVVTAEERKSHNEYHFDTKAVIVPLVSSTGHGHASLKRVHYQEGKFAVGNILCVIEPIDLDLLIPKYLHVYLSYFKDRLLVPLMRGAANVSLSIKSIKTVEIEIPSLEIQQKVIDLTKHLQGKVDDLSDKFEYEINLIKQLRQAILQEAIQGKLVPQNPNDESASVLLERIKAEKAELIKAKKIRKEKPLPPISEDEIPFELPDGWVWCRLGEITTKIGSGSTPRGGKSAYVENGTKFFRSQNIYDNGIVLKDIVYINEATNIKMKNTIVKPNDLLLNITGGSIGRCALISNDFDIGNVSQHVCIIRPIISKFSSFLHKLILSNYIQTTISNSITGAGREGLPKYKLEQFLIPLPPLSEQKRIVEKVEALMLMCERLEEQVKGSAKDVEVLMQAVLQEAFG